MSRNTRTDSTLLVLLLVGVCVTVSMARGPQRGSELTDVVIVRGAPAQRLASLGAEVLETYDAFSLVSAGAAARRNLEREGLVVEEIPERTSAGRGAYRFDSRQGEPTMPDALRADPMKEPDYDVYIVQFIGPVKSDWVEALRAAGADVFAYLPSYSYVTAMGRGEAHRVEALRFVQWVGLYHPAYKIDPALLETSEASTTISFSLLPGRDSQRAERVVAASGGAVLERWKIGDQPWIRASVGTSSLIELARLQEVFSIEPYFPPDFVNDKATWVVQSDVLNNRSIHTMGLHGEGQLVTMADQTLSILHPMFYDSNPIGPSHRKIEACQAVAGCTTTGCSNPYGPLQIGHGTLVAGVLTGDAPTVGAYNDHDGHAFLSRLVAQDLGWDVLCAGQDVIGKLFQPSFNVSSRIHTNSWGTITPTYCPGAAGSDQFMWDNPDFLIVFAAGNELAQGARCEARAKDIITVGGSGNGTQANDAYTLSSQGPTSDGRLKPTVVAPGENICSAWDPNIGAGVSCDTPPINSNYSRTSGTSFAAPAVAGSAALVRQYFAEGWYPSGAKVASQGLVPSAALLKATLVNGAEEMTGAGAYSGTWVKGVTSPVYSGTHALKATKEQNSTDAATAVTSTPAPDPNAPSTLDLRFFVPKGVAQGQMTIADDGVVKSQITSGGVATATVQVVGSNGTRQTTVSLGAWHHLEILYNTPSAGQFQAKVNGVSLGSALNVMSPASSSLTVGAGTSAGSYGELVVDNACYFQWGEEVWCDDFDASLSIWTVTPDTDETGYPNNRQGWGRIKLDDSLYFSGDSRKLLACDDRAGLRTGFQRVTKVQVTDTSQPLEVTLTWSDRPGTDPNHETINNLDLTVTSPSGLVYRGNCFQGRNPGQSVDTVADPNCLADTVNVEENILRVAPTESGTWIVTVTGQNVDPSGGNKPQPFALAVTGGVVSPTAEVIVTAVADQQTGPGAITSGSWASTVSSNNVREAFQETLSTGYQLTHVWRLENVPCRASYILTIEGYRPNGANQDNFQFSWAPEVNGAPGTFQDIPGAIINSGRENPQGVDYPFVAPGLSGTIYIRVRDTGTGSQQTSLYMDKVTVR